MPILSGAPLLRVLGRCVSCARLKNITTKATCDKVEEALQDARPCEWWVVSCPHCHSTHTSAPSCSTATWVCHSCNQPFPSFNDRADPYLPQTFDSKKLL